MRDALAHRGPDGEGLWTLQSTASSGTRPRLSNGQVVLAHRRLAVVDPTPNAAQPMVDPQGRGAIVYNGELYNDAELRLELATLGWVFKTRSDTETVLAALVQWGEAGLGRLRGMFALGFCDTTRGTLLLARDPLGIKPLCWWMQPATGGGGGEPAQLAFASEIPALLRHPLIPCRPDFVAINAYLTTIRTTMGRRTLFEGVRTLLPGEAIEFDLSRPDLAARRFDHSPRASATALNDREIAGAVRAAVDDSVARHLRSDVPTCALLSGGLDSSIIATLVAQHDPRPSTFCSGARSSDASDDFAFASQVARRLGTDHHEAPVTREMFRERWPLMIDQMGLPLSTPNEVAINQVARVLRGLGNVVALSGEGADELFGGYAVPLAAASEFLRSGREDLVGAIVEDSAWIPPSARAAVLRDPAWGDDAHEHLMDWYRSELEGLSNRGAASPDPLEPVLRLQRRVNLEGLLRRFDSATMLEGVEGRTPFADIKVATLAESLPMRHKFRWDAGGRHATKVSLRAAYAHDLPPEIVARDKASFPLPFQEWVADHVGSLTTSSLAQELFSDAALLAVATKPGEAWRFAWPMMNIAMWGKKWWG